MDIDRAQRWWDRVRADLLLRRGQSGLGLLEAVGDVGQSPYLLRIGLERLKLRLQQWLEEGTAPAWARRLHLQATKHLEALRCVPPLGSEGWVSK